MEPFDVNSVQSGVTHDQMQGHVTWGVGKSTVPVQLRHANDTVTMQGVEAGFAAHISARLMGCRRRAFFVFVRVRYGEAVRHP
ncbi:hypothetical protein MRX96_011294 [Rhipicephalus microplus]